MLTTVKLRGHLAEQFGPSHTFDIASPKEAISALMANFAGFAEALYGDGKTRFRVFVDNVNKSDKLELCFRFSPGKHVVKLVPVIEGAGGKRGVGQTIAGAVLVVVGAVASVYGQAWGSALVRVGAGMMIGGVASMLAANPRIQKNDGDSKRKQSYVYQGPSTTAGLGACVPVVYGIVECPPVVVSQGLYAEAYNLYTTIDEPTSGFRITSPRALDLVYAENAAALAATSAVDITFASQVGVATASIKSQDSDVKGFSPNFTISGPAGAQRLSLAPEVPVGVHTCLLVATDESGNSTEKLYTVKCVAVEYRDDDSNPRLRDDNDKVQINPNENI